MWQKLAFPVYSRTPETVAIVLCTSISPAGWEPVSIIRSVSSLRKNWKVVLLMWKSNSDLSLPLDSTGPGCRCSALCQSAAVGWVPAWGDAAELGHFAHSCRMRDLPSAVPLMPDFWKVRLPNPYYFWVWVTSTNSCITIHTGKTN